MNKNPESGKYYLENELRTWSELKQRAAAMDAANADSNGSAARLKLQTAQSPVLRRWGGCAFGCDHDKIKFPRRVRRRDTSDIMNGNGNLTKPAEKTSQSYSQNEKTTYQSHHSYHQTSKNGTLSVNEEPSAPPPTSPHKQDVTNHKFTHARNSIPEEPTGLAYTQPAFNSIHNGSSEQTGWARNHGEHKMGCLYIDGSNDSGNFLSTSPAALQFGRDGGGSLSGAASPTGIKSEEDDYFDSTLNAAADSKVSQHPPYLSSSSSLPLATAQTPPQPQQQQETQHQSQNQPSSTEYPTSSASASAAAAITPSSTPSHPPSSTLSSPSYQSIPEKWTSQSGMGAGAQAEPLGDYDGIGASKTEENGADELGKNGNINGERGVDGKEEGGGGGGRGGGGQNLKAVQRAEERSNSVGESVY